ncbi:MAG: hypothetical protein IKF00_06235 [Solobacterium sp.]|nr:hypothetical protein [Solobacterium sp.]
MFARQLTLLLDTLEVSGSDLAGYAQIDRTAISRMKNGSRQPKHDGTSVRKLIHGIISYCSQNGKTDTLLELAGIENPSAEELSQALLQWLYEDSNADEQNTASPTECISGQSFGTHLSAVMNLTGISNIRLSQLVYADASLISRYRRSERRPKSGSDIAMRICRVLWERIEKADRVKELCDLMMCSEADEQSFYAWLFESSPQVQTADITAEKLISLMNTAVAVPQAARHEMPVLPESEIRDIYHGTAGLRSAVLRFLKNAVEQRVQQMFLYSDENMDWLSGDPAFFRAWAALMHACVVNHTEITIIHHVNRNMKELSDAVAGWLPLYLSGMISSYFCRRDERFQFTNTMFLIPGMACIRASHVRGLEAEGVYHYHTDRESLDQFEKEYRSLIRQASPLFAILPGMHLPEGNDQVIIRNTLPLGTMSEETVRSFGHEGLYRTWETVRYQLNDTSHDSVKEFIPVSECCIEEQICTEPVPGIPQFVYSEEQYHQHINDIRNLAAEHDSYHPVFLKHRTFDNVQIFITDTKVSVIRMYPSLITFETSHPQMCRAFLDYADRLQQSSSAEETA